ncbi:hypothetical protein [Streptomyces sp. NPDC005017]|uniref:hypothetical protein n=1 Tax=Streptomyces sp. NPDC005017 TaxID=3364706 RepID=UPI003678046D
MPTRGHDHRADELCEPGRELYAHALRSGSVTGPASEAAPRVLGLGVLRPAVTDPDRLEPVAPALHRTLRSSEQRVADERERAAHMAETLESLMHAGTTTSSAQLGYLIAGSGNLDQEGAHA